MNQEKIEIDSSIFSLQAVKNTCYDFSGEYWIEINTNDDYFYVFLKQKSENFLSDNLERTKDNFLNSLIDHQTRIDTAKEFKTIREMIVAQAFEPCENINEVVEYLNNGESD